MFETWFPNLLDLLQIYLLTVPIYYALRFLKGTRAAQILIGAAGLWISAFIMTSLFDLDVLNVVFRWVTAFLLLAMLVVFHPELRRALSMLGRSTYFQILQGRFLETPVEKLVRITRTLANRKLGALIAVERSVSLDRWCETGVQLDALISTELLISIFTPPLPLHDGGIILRDQRVRAAHCIFPIDNELRIQGVGTRHRAAVTLSVECDALILVVSEERGQVSVARDGTLLQNISDRHLERLLRAAFVPKEEQRNFYHRVFGPQHSIPLLLRPVARIIRHLKEASHA